MIYLILVLFIILSFSMFNVIKTIIEQHKVEKEKNKAKLYFNNHIDEIKTEFDKYGFKILYHFNNNLTWISPSGYWSVEFNLNHCIWELCLKNEIQNNFKLNIENCSPYIFCPRDYLINDIINKVLNEDKTIKKLIFNIKKTKLEKDFV